MNKEKAIAYLKQSDEETRPERANRLLKFEKVTYGVELPENLWDYITRRMKGMYVDGHFAGAIVFAAAIVESVLKDKVREKLSLTDEELEDLRLNMPQTLLLYRKLNVIESHELETIKEMMASRNALVHISRKKVDREKDLEGSVFKYVKFTRNLCSKLYPERQE